mmetsp:Transcript_60921/g.149917  ORF Transcript_60921/g.149917 Transcript_60921/m.149917 type:complete len:205 (+) Transcript_60921:214-828(+)|eukprot:CAMPEP_0206231374 /NCGR_PEP_ID=MMETSP0047_2-20121206/10799_1 /ASSEMBLY_ACC=CAM_ASM_000192 /TAXON_ID=195065 /ORGANISM="Chroomonas mesostigmatica_cf, Strain CCMP1168" /LENGTH=204 /DNA_ID=CAMNT_0053654941 /DNA_START=193 /DNA_END=807 /DNA_ORIENTATION=+
MEGAEARVAGKTRPRAADACEGADPKRAKPSKGDAESVTEIFPEAPAVQPVRESSSLSEATTRNGSDDTDSDRDKNDPPLLFMRRQSSSGSLDRCVPRTFSASMLQVEVTPWSSPLGLQRKPSAAGFHLSCPFQDLMQLEKGGSENDTEAVPSPSTMTSITTVSEELKAIEEMKRVQEKAKKAAREHVDAKYNLRQRKQATAQA